MKKYAVYEIDHTKLPGKISPRLIKLSVLQGHDEEDARLKISTKTGIAYKNIYVVPCPKVSRG